MTYLFKAMQLEHMLWSTFLQDSVCGWIYIDMNKWTMTLDMDDERFPSVGDWVTVHCGLYKGDVGYIQSIENWEQVSHGLIMNLRSEQQTMNEE